MALRFDHRVAIVTGAGRGLGRAYALDLAARGARVVVNDVDSGTDGATTGDAAVAEQVVAEIESHDGIAVADSNSVVTGGDAVVATALEAFGRVDIVVHNAGVVSRTSFENMAGPVLDDVLGVSLLGAFNISRAAWPHLVRQGYGRIVITSSGAGLFGGAQSGNYAAAKMGSIGLALSLAAEGAEHGIHTNVIVPIAKTRLATTLPPHIIERLRPEFVAPVVTWLAHEDCPANGEIYSAAGGRVNRVAIAINTGIQSDNLDAETVRDSFDEIRRLDDAQPVTNSPQALELRLPK